MSTHNQDIILDQSDRLEVPSDVLSPSLLPYDAPPNESFDRSADDALLLFDLFPIQDGEWSSASCDGLAETALPHLDSIGSDESHDLGNNLPPLPASANTTTAPTNTNTTIGVMNANINTHVDANAGANINTNRYQCPQCNTTCARDGDLSRHMKKHLPPQYDCLVNGCDRHGHKAFNRRDKLHDHQRKKHRMPL
ncbi:hypothetical protein MMC22_011137 [Lobaria immixta]|nr:hypothetical protein [Lobaria immixta]